MIFCILIIRERSLKVKVDPEERALHPCDEALKVQRDVTAPA